MNVLLHLAERYPHLISLSLTHSLPPPPLSFSLFLSLSLFHHIPVWDVFSALLFYVFPFTTVKKWSSRLKGIFPTPDVKKNSSGFGIKEKKMTNYLHEKSNEWNAEHSLAWLIIKMKNFHEHCQALLAASLFVCFIWKDFNPFWKDNLWTDIILLKLFFSSAKMLKKLFLLWVVSILFTQ